MPHVNGGTLKAAMHGDIDFIDPALAYYQTSWQVEYATCVKLLNYPDKSGDAGKQLIPEAASAMPTVSADGKTYTFTVPPGKYKFNTGEPVTAATFQHAIERDLSPKQGSYFGETFLTDVVGASTYKGLPAHVSGIKVTGDKLAISLTEKDAGFLSKVATPFACAIPKATPDQLQGRSVDRRRRPVLHRQLGAASLAAAQEEPVLSRPAAALPERDRLHADDARPEPGDARAQERPARLLPRLRGAQPVVRS